MGYRANTITKHREYGGQPFSGWEGFIDFVNHLEAKGCDVMRNDNEDYFEVEVDQLKPFMETLPENDEASPCTGMTNRELRQALKDSIDQTKGHYVAWEWF